jgi:hypothetical protein
MNPDQNNTRAHGPITVFAAQDLTAARSLLGVLIAVGNAPAIKLPADDTAERLYAINENAAQNAQLDIEPFVPARNFRVPLTGTCVPGDVLVLDTAKPGALKKSTGTEKARAIAEEAGVDGQHILCRPL